MTNADLELELYIDRMVGPPKLRVIPGSGEPNYASRYLQVMRALRAYQARKDEMSRITFCSWLRQFSKDFPALLQDDEIAAAARALCRRRR